MTNGTNGSALCAEIMRSIAKVYHWPGYPMPTEKEAAAADLPRYHQIAGKYELGGGFTVTVIEEGGKLFAAAPDQPKSELIPSPDGSFFTIDEGVEISFLKDAQGRVISLSAMQGGQKFTLKRVEPGLAQPSPH